MQEHFYALYVFTVQSNGGVAPPPPYLSTLKTYPTTGERPRHPVFASKWPQRMPGPFRVKRERFRVSGEKPLGVVPPTPSLDEG